MKTNNDMSWTPDYIDGYGPAWDYVFPRDDNSWWSKSIYCRDDLFNEHIEEYLNNTSILLETIYRVLRELGITDYVSVVRDSYATIVLERKYPNESDAMVFPTSMTDMDMVEYQISAWVFGWKI